MPCTASCISENNVLLNSPNPIAATIARGNDDVCDTTHMHAQHIRIAPAITATLAFCVTAILSAGMGFTSQALLPPDTALLPTNPACATTAPPGTPQQYQGPQRPDPSISKMP